MRALVAAPHASACARRAGDEPTPHARAESCAVASTSGSALPISGRDVSGRVVFFARPGWRAGRAATARAPIRVLPLRRSSHIARSAESDRSAPAPASASSLGNPGSSADGDADLDDAIHANDPGDLDLDPDAPTDLLAVACGVGLLTGLGVGAFNIAEHGVHDLVFLTTTVYSPDRFRVEGMRDVRPETWVQAFGTVAAPTAAGFAVTGLRFLAGGFDGEEAPRWGSKRGSLGAKATDAAASAPNGTAAPTSRFAESARAAARPALKAAAAVMTLGAGASLGPEGPSVEIGASIATSLDEATRSKRPASSRRASGKDGQKRAPSRRLGLVAAGSAAGISAGFGAPIAGLFFAFESVLQPASARRAGVTAGDADDLAGGAGFGALTTESVILASVLAAVASGALLGEQPAFIVPAFELKTVAELPLYLPLGLLCGATAVAFRSSSAVIGKGFAALERGAPSVSLGGAGSAGRRDEDASFALRVPREWHAPLGGAAFGVVASLFPEVTYQGFDNVNSMLGAEGSPFRTPYSPSLLTALVLVKLAATALCRQSGLVGGVYAPSLFMGAALGSAYGAALVPLALAGVPVAPPQAYALVGMAGVLAGICRVPLTAILLLFELTHDYRIIVPLMGTVGVASWVAGAAERGRAFPAGGEGGNVPARASYVAVEVPKGKAEGVVGGGGVLSFDDDDAFASPTRVSSPRRSAEARAALDAARAASRAARVSDAVRTDAPRVLASASALDAARDAREAVRDGSAARCALVVDPDGTLLGVATAKSLAAAVAAGRGETSTAVEACDGDVPLVASSWTLREAEARMRARNVTLAAVVATVREDANDRRGGADGEEDGRRLGAALGVLEAGAAAAERDAAALSAALRAREAEAAKRGGEGRARRANAPR